jgi:2-methylfumaryl-CoA isomerase
MQNGEGIKGAGPLGGMKIFESTAFIAAPLATMSLAQMGAEVVRFDAPEGGLDYHRWPLAPSGASLYWSMLNRGKKSATLDMRYPENRKIAADMICTTPGGGIFVTNLPAKDALSPEQLFERDPRTIIVTLDGSPDGMSAIDYTVHAACGAAMMTGPKGHDGPINNIVPLWDIICGRTLAMGLLAAELERQKTGLGQHVKLSLSDIAMECMANVGILAETELACAPRARDGNWIYGSFGRDFKTADDRWFMLTAVTRKQWRALVAATGTAKAIEKIELEQGISLDSDSAIYGARHAIGALIEDWADFRTLAQITAEFSGTAVCWSPYRDTSQLLAEDARASETNPLFVKQAHPDIPAVLTPRSPVRFSNHGDLPVQSAPRLGADNDAIKHWKNKLWQD